MGPVRCSTTPKTPSPPWSVPARNAESYFGPSFEFERPVDDDNGYVLDIVRCLFHELLVATGRSELQPLLCRFDLNWVDAIDPARHRLRFVRPVTFATGKSCRMCFLRTEHLDGLIVEGSGNGATNR
jgi:hypothetical protein